MNEVYVLLVVVTVLSSALIPTIYLRIKKKQFLETLETKFIECEVNGYRILDNQERQLLKEEYTIVERKNMKILFPIVIVSTIITGIPILAQIIDIPLCIANIYINIVFILFAVLIAFIALSILETYFKIFRVYKNKLLIQYVYTHIDEDIWDIVVETIVFYLTAGIIISIIGSMFIGCMMVWPVENAYALYCIMLVATNIIVTKNICRKQHKYLKQLILYEAGLS